MIYTRLQLFTTIIIISVTLPVISDFNNETVFKCVDNQIMTFQSAKEFKGVIHTAGIHHKKL